MSVGRPKDTELGSDESRSPFVWWITVDVFTLVKDTLRQLNGASLRSAHPVIMTSPAAHEPPFALDGTVTRHKLRELLDVQTELPWLDFKEECSIGYRSYLVDRPPPRLRNDDRTHLSRNRCP